MCEAREKRACLRGGRGESRVDDGLTEASEEDEKEDDEKKDEEEEDEEEEGIGGELGLSDFEDLEAAEGEKASQSRCEGWKGRSRIGLLERQWKRSTFEGIVSLTGDPANEHPAARTGTDASGRQGEGGVPRGAGVLARTLCVVPTMV